MAANGSSVASSFLDAVSAAPHVHDAEKASSALAGLPSILKAGPMGALLRGACGSSPYLARLTMKHRDWLADSAQTSPDQALAALMEDLNYRPDDPRTLADLSQALRTTKSRAALLIALADLGGIWGLEQVTSALTLLADTCVTTSATWLLAQELRNMRLPGLDLDALESGAGYVVLAMGKMGAQELNYSSDIDLIALFDSARFDTTTVLDVRTRYIHVTRQLVKLLSDTTADGYAFRTDLRLRPAPSTTPVCMATEAAERYYESVGRTWERAAHIKARPLMDRQAGGTYLRTLSPFVWRRHLDFAAIDDIHEMLRKIRAQQAKFTRSGLPGHDVKLGLGGIREIEFFAQTRQLIVGGRDPGLRVRTTVGALRALTSAGWIDASTRDILTEDYKALRIAEHRLQMIEDAQTHQIPLQQEARARVAALSGMTLDAYETGLVERLARVHALCEDFFGARHAPRRASDTAPTADSLEKAGFQRPSDAERLIARWQNGEIPATRSERAQGLFADIQSQILARLSGGNDPDQALIQFDRFLCGLPAGVQVFSLFAANPQLLDLIVEICTAAPRLASYLARHPQTLDALLDHEFWEHGQSLETLGKDLDQRLAALTDYERVLDETRRWARERWFRTGVHVLRGIADPLEAGLEFSNIAEAYLSRLLPWVEIDFASRHGPPPGTGLAVLAMGKLGSREMTAASDLDLITIFEAGDAETSDGPRPLQAAVYYRRLTQSLVSALTAPTAEGALYEVDMRLRPSGRSGPVAVSRAGFERYQMKDAWVWEHLALTRARPVAGPSSLCQDVQRVVDQALARRRNDPAVITEASDMRTRLIEAHRQDRTDPWSLKHTAGGLMEIEFLGQVGVLLRGMRHPQRVDQMLEDLAGDGWLSRSEADALMAAALLQQGLQHIQRVALDGPISPEAIGTDLRQVLSRTNGSPDFETLAASLVATQKVAAEIVASRLD